MYLFMIFLVTPQKTQVFLKLNLYYSVIKKIRIFIIFVILLLSLKKINMIC